MSEEEKKALWYFSEVLTYEEDVEQWKVIENLIDKQQKEIEEKSTIIMVGAEKVKRLEKEIEEKNVAINKMSKDISRQLEEIEEKTTILFAGAEKVKQLEKGNRSLMESRIKWKNRYYKEKAKNKECISRDKIREKIKKAKEIKWHTPKLVIEYFEELLEEE